MISVIALHGDFANGRMFAWDIGIRNTENVRWRYPDWKRESRENLISILSCFPNLVLVGYSRGGDKIAKLSHQLSNIRGAVLYESPILPARNQIKPSGDFPVLWIENDEGMATKSRRKKKIMSRSKHLWALNRSMTCLTGVGKHVKVNPLGHGWDQALNQQILEWIERNT